MSFDAGQTTTTQGGKVEVLALTPLTGCRASERNGSRGNKRNPKCTHTDPGTYTEAPSQDTRWCIPLLGGRGDWMGMGILLRLGGLPPAALPVLVSGIIAGPARASFSSLPPLPFPLLPLARLRAELSMLSLSSSLSSSQVGFYFLKKGFSLLNIAKCYFWKNK